MIQDHAELIRIFYTSFQSRDYATMQSLYHPDAVFSDPVFLSLNSREVKAMWQMLLTTAKDLRVEFYNVEAGQCSGSCRWNATYTFSRTGRHVHNRISSTFEFKDNLIIRHVDNFDFWKWSRQALGVSGLMLGWTPFLRRTVQAMARRSLERFLSSS